MKYTKLAFAFAVTALVGQVSAATSQVDFSNTDVLITNLAGVALTSGGDAIGDGAVIQIGYFSTSTSGFQGEWVAITGNGSLNSSILTSVGDGGDSTSSGIFSGIAAFDTAVHTGIPTGGTQLAIRIYDGTTVATSTTYNTVTSTAWTFVAPATPAPLPAVFSLDTATLVWQDSANAFKTSILVPEPSTMMLGAIGALGLLRRRR